MNRGYYALLWLLLNTSLAPSLCKKSNMPSFLTLHIIELNRKTRLSKSPRPLLQLHSKPFSSRLYR